MTAKSTTGSGNWTDAIWTPAGTPGIEDTVDILTGHTVTLDQSVEVGADTTTAAIHVNTGGKLQVLSTLAADVILTLQGDLLVDGTVEFGTVANPIPSSRIFTVKLNKSAAGADGKYGWIINPGSTCTVQGYVLPVWKTLLTVNAGINDTALTVSDSTGWVNGNLIVIAGTNRPTGPTDRQCEKLTVSSTSGTTLNVTSGLVYAHAGVSPIQAEIINLTRNIKVTSFDTTTGGMGYAGYVYAQTTSVSNFDGVEFSYVGYNLANKYTFAITTTTGSCSIENCAVHDTKAAFTSTSNANNISFKNIAMGWVGLITAWNNTFYISGYGGACSNETLDNICVIGAGSNTISVSSVFYISSSSYQSNVVFSNLTTASCTASNGINLGLGIGMTDWPNRKIASNMISHSNCGLGISFGGTGAKITNIKSYRNSSGGINGGGGDDFIGENWEVFGNGSYGGWGRIASIVRGTYRNLTFNGDTTYSQSEGIHDGGGYILDAHFYDCNFSVESGIKTKHTTADISREGYFNYGDKIYFHNCVLNATNPISGFHGTASYPNNATAGQPDDYGVCMEEVNGVANTFKSYFNTGIIQSDIVIYHTAPRSVRMLPSVNPILINRKHRSQPTKKVAIKSGQRAILSVWVRESVVGDASGVKYNGNRIRLMLKRSDRLGVTDDITVLATATVASVGAWEKISGQTPIATKDGVFEVYVDCDGTAGWINYQDWEVA